MRFEAIHRIAMTIIAVSALLVAGWFGIAAWGLISAARLGPAGIAAEAGRMASAFDHNRQSRSTPTAEGAAQ